MNTNWGVERPEATLSIDLDPVEAHLAGYGIRASQDDRVYERAAHRLLELLEKAGLHATWFIVAADAERQAGLLQKIVNAGHEIASHSVGHPADFGSLRREQREWELRESRARLEDAALMPVHGFRAPGWDRPSDLADELQASGYRYDASSFPTPLLTALRLNLWRQAKGKRPNLCLDAWRAPRTPHRLSSGLLCYPVSTTPRLRVPVYHTLRYSLGDRMERWIEAVAERNEPLSYPLHGVDALGMEADRIDGRLAHHPGMKLPLEQKLELLARTFDLVRRRFSVSTFAARTRARS